MASSAEMYIGKIWPSLKVEKSIGSGASGEVFKVCRQGMGKQYYSAVKVIQIPKSESEILELRSDGLDDVSIRQYCRELVEQMSDEIDLMESLKSAPNIVSIEDFHVMEKKGGFGWIALIRMELLENLNDYLDRKGIREENVLKLGIDLCTALEYCEKRGVVHRDIKPANVFVTEFGDFKLGDFGISRQSWLSSLRSTKGTYAYMAPEVARGESYDKTVDLYSLGVMMYRLLNDNRLPFMPLPPAPMSYEDNRAAISKRFAGECLTPPTHGSPELSGIILKACSYRSEDRFPGALQMKEALIQCRTVSRNEGNLIDPHSNPLSVTKPMSQRSRGVTVHDAEEPSDSSSFMLAGDLSPSRILGNSTSDSPIETAASRDDISSGFMPAGGLI